MPRLTARTGPGRQPRAGARRRHPGIAVAVTAATLLAVAGVGTAAAATPQPTVTLAGAGTPAWTAQATSTGAMAANSTISLSVVLNGRDDAAAAAQAQAVSSPTSSSYGQYLTPAAYTSTYAATDADVAAVTGWLTGAGFTVTSVPANHLWVRVTGTAADVQKAFGTSLNSYVLGGAAVHAPAGAVTVPASIQPLIAGVAGLSSEVRRNQPLDGPGDPGDLSKNRVQPSGPRPGAAPAAGQSAPPAPAFVNAPPCSAYWGQKPAATLPPANGSVVPYAPCGYTPAQLRGAYGVNRIGVTGGGATVAIVDAYNSPTIVSDADTYARNRGDRAFGAGQFRQLAPASYSYGYYDTVNGDQCGEQGWYGEETLDVEAVHGLAPSADVLYVGAASCQDSDLIDALNKVVAGHLASIISDSWGDAGEPDPTDPTQAAILAAYQHVFIQAALTGIGIFFSSGDNGDETSGNPANPASGDFPATSPWVTAVGGTTLGVGSQDNYLFEEAWGTGRSILTDGAWTPAYPGTYLYGGGGGTSQIFPQPFYQRGVVPAAISQRYGGAPGRAEPDVAAVGDPNTGYLIGQTQTFPDGSVRYSEYRIGGTSLSSPVTAGIEALADSASGRPHGFANPAIYQLYRTRAVHDVTTLSAPVGDVRVDYVNETDATGGLTTSLRAFQQLNTLTSTAGYDDTTGVGTPNGYLYVYGLGQITSRAISYATAKAG